MTQSKTPAFIRRVPVSTAETRCPASDLSHVQDGCGACAGDAPLPCGGDGGELLDAREDAGDLRPGRPGAGDGAGSGHDGVCVDGYTAPVTASPYDPWHSEEYLLMCLVRHHGWYWLRPRVLAGPWIAKRVKSFMKPEGE